MNFLEKLDYMMEKMSINKSKLSQISGVPYTTIDGFYKKGYENTKISTIRKIAAALDVSLDYLVDDNITDESYQPPQAKKTPSDLSEEAFEIARSYHQLDEHGKGAVKAIMEYEGKTASAEPREKSGQVIGLSFPRARRKHSGITEIDVYDQPAAAGLGNYLDAPEHHVEQYPIEVIPDNADFGVVISGDSMEPKVHDGGTVFVQATPSIDPGQIGIFVLNEQAYCKKLMVDHDNRQIRLVSLNPKYDDIIIGEFDALKTLGRVLGQWTPGQKQDLLGW